MKLDNVRIRCYRSARDVQLLDAGNFNVLIGKNNSGKSTILFAVHAFFRCIARGAVSTHPPLGKSLDFSKGVEDEPIRVTLTFSMQLAERDALIRDIATEAPQVKNAIDGLDPSMKLEVTVAIPRAPDHYSYVEGIYLVGSASANRRTLLNVGQPAALELVRKFQASRNTENSVKQMGRLLESVDADDFRRMASRDPEARGVVNYYQRRFDLSPPVVSILESLLNAGPGFAEFQSHLRTQIGKYLADEEKNSRVPLKNTVETFSGDQDAVPQYATNLLTRLSETSILYLTEQRRPVGRAEAERVLSFKVKRGGTESLRNIQQTVQGLLGVQVDAFESSAAGEKSAEMDVDNFLLEVNGSGIREALRLILDVEFQHPTILLVEEPEVHLHPALETNMMRYLKGVSRNCQVFISTHSTNFLDNSDMKNVYLVSKPQSSTEVQSVDVEEAESKIPKELGLRLSSLFMFDRLVFVEGPTDEAVLREWTSILGLNLSQANVGFVPMGGVRNFAHYATEATLSLLTKRQVGMWFIIDRDEREQTDVSKLEAHLRNKAKINVLSKRELENYLIVPRVVAEFIKVKQSMAKGPHATPDERSVAQAVLECADELKQFAIAKSVAKTLCTPLYLSAMLEPDDLQGGIEPKLSGELERLRQGLEVRTASLQKVIEEKTHKVEGAWDREKLDLVPGDLLLDRACRRFGVRFKKDVDSARLAALMDVSELDAQIKALIREIAG